MVCADALSRCFVVVGPGVHFQRAGVLESGVAACGASVTSGWLYSRQFSFVPTVDNTDRFGSNCCFRHRILGIPDRFRLSQLASICHATTFPFVDGTEITTRVYCPQRKS